MIPLCRDNETYNTRTVVHFTFNLTPHLLYPDDGNPISVANLHLHRPYHVARAVARLDPPVQICLIKDAGTNIDLLQRSQSCLRPPLLTQPDLILSDAIRIAPPLYIPSGLPTTQICRKIPIWLCAFYPWVRSAPPHLVRVTLQPSQNQVSLPYSLEIRCLLYVHCAFRFPSLW